MKLKIKMWIFKKLFRKELDYIYTVKQQVIMKDAGVHVGINIALSALHLF